MWRIYNCIMEFFNIITIYIMMHIIKITIQCHGIVITSSYVLYDYLHKEFHRYMFYCIYSSKLTNMRIDVQSSVNGNTTISLLTHKIMLCILVTQVVVPAKSIFCLQIRILAMVIDGNQILSNEDSPH